MGKVKCYSVRLQALYPVSPRAMKAIAYDGTTAIIRNRRYMDRIMMSLNLMRIGFLPGFLIRKNYNTPRIKLLGLIPTQGRCCRYRLLINL